jgi:hypothetical protein
VCGFCGNANTNANVNPIVSICRKCGVEPKAYKCHHPACGQLIFFSKDYLETNYAYCLNAPTEIPERTSKLKAKQENIQDKEHEIQIAKSDVMLAKLDAELGDLKRKSEPIKIKTPFQQKEEGLKNYLAGVMGARELAAKQKAENAVIYKDRPDDLKDANQAVDDWLKRNV